MEKENELFNDTDEQLEDRFEDLYDYNLFDLLAGIDEEVCDRSRTELEINPRLKKIIAR